MVFRKCVVLVFLLLAAVMFGADSELNYILKMERSILDNPLYTRIDNSAENIFANTSPFFELRYTGLLNQELLLFSAHNFGLYGGIPLSDILLFADLNFSVQSDPLSSEFAFRAKVGIKKQIWKYAGFSLAVDSVFSDKGFGIYGDLNYFQIIPEFLFFNNFQFDLYLDNFGWDNVSSDVYIPEPFTLRINTSGQVAKWKWGIFDLAMGVSFPGFSQFRFDLGFSLKLFNIFKIDTSLAADITELESGDFSSFIPDVRLTFSIPASGFEGKFNLGWDIPKEGYHALHGEFGMAPVSVDRAGPVIVNNSGSSIQFSPNNDQIQDELNVSLLITDDNNIHSYSFTVKDLEGTSVYEENFDFYEKNKNPVVNIFKNLKSSNLDIVFEWKGYDNEGLILPDGEYYITIEAVDIFGNKGAVDIDSVIIDTVFPTAAVDLGNSVSIFSPNEDGYQDELLVTMTSSNEASWNVSIRTVDEIAVYEAVLSESNPVLFTWNGTAKDGNSVTDGSYSLVFSTEDDAGNQYYSDPYLFTVDNGIASVIIEKDGMYLSPNKDGKMDVLVFTFTVPDQDKVLSHSLLFYNDQKELVKEIKNASVEFESYTFTGSGLKDGWYFAALEVVYSNGSRPNAFTDQFKIDTTSPAAEISSDKKIFSPDNDGIDDEIIFYQESSEELSWSGIIEDIDGFEIETFSWTGKADKEFSWNGFTKYGYVLDDGVYVLHIFSEDSAGNKGRSNKFKFELSTVKTAVSLIPQYSAFSPNNDKVMDSIKITPRIEKQSSINKFSFEIIYTKTGAVVFSQSGSSALPPVFIWLGKDNKGKAAGDGDYSAKLTIQYYAGNTSISNSRSFTVDTRAPEVTVYVKSGLFSPNQDGKNDRLEISQNSSAENVWEGRILDSSGNIIKLFTWNGSVSNVSWDGTDIQGNSAPDGIYKYEITAADTAGNSILKILEPLIVDTSEIKGNIEADLTKFSPNGSPSSVKFIISLSNKNGVKDWEFILSNTDGRSLKTFSGKKSFPKQITWDGKNDNNSVVDGLYTARFTVNFERGDVVSVSSAPVEVDTKAPNLQISASPVFVNFEYSKADIALSIIGPSEEIDLELSVSTGKLKKSSFNKIMPNKNAVKLTLTDTEMRYPIPLTITVKASDSLGNTITYELPLAIDVKQEKYGNNLFINGNNVLNREWKDGSTNVITIVKERISAIISSKNYDTILINLDDKWILYTLDKNVTAEKGSALTSIVINYIAKGYYQKKNFYVISKKEAEAVYKSLKE